MYNLPISGRNNRISIFVSCILLLAAFVFSSLSSAASANAIREYGDIVQLRSAGQFLNAPGVSDILEKRDFEDEEEKYTAWSQGNDINVENYSLGSRARLDHAIYYYGDNSGLFNLILDNGCALSEAAAFKIFGTAEGVLGEAVIINGEVYTVEKLLYGDATPMIYKVGKDNAKMNFDVLNITSDESAGFSASEMQLKYGINGDIAIAYRDVIKSSSAFGRLILWAAVIIAALIFTKRITKGSRNIIRWAGVCGELIFAVLLCGALIGSPFFLPDSFIPTRWSEFEFWSGAFSQLGDALKYYFSMKTYGPDVLFKTYILQNLFFAVLSAVCMFVSLLKLFKLLCIIVER